MMKSSLVLIALMAFILTPLSDEGSVMAQENEPVTDGMRSLAQAAMSELTENGGGAAIEFLEAQADKRLVLEVCEALMPHYYWQEKNLELSLLFGRTGVKLGNDLAAASEDTAESDQLRTHVKIITYNIASFSWTGWDEPGVQITPEQEAQGFAAARSNLQLAIDLEKLALPISRAWWLLGAHLLTAGEYQESADAFKQAAGLAAQADKRDEQLLSQAFRQLAIIQYLPESGKDEQRLYGYLDKLSELPDGDVFTNQVETARQVLGGK
jgi:tetratricopeptide (TPR) repeat protein